MDRAVNNGHVPAKLKLDAPVMLGTDLGKKLFVCIIDSRHAYVVLLFFYCFMFVFLSWDGH